MSDELELGAVSATTSEPTQPLSEATAAPEAEVTETSEAQPDQAPEAPAEPQAEATVAPDLHWFTVTTPSEREPIALRALDHIHAEQQFKKLRGIIDTPHAINAQKALVYHPTARDLEHDAVLYPELQKKA